MGSYNKATFVGNLTRTPKEVATKSGKTMASFGLAVNDRFKKDGETLFIDILTFGRTAEFCLQYLEVGVNILAEGNIKLGMWTDNQGKSKPTLTLMANDVISNSRAEKKEKPEDDPHFNLPPQDDEIPF
mgnify:CR=1 FL=1|tara:strand:+ start:30710 stop:31096 length:387 start_codon:yes stop_codon:yes gene_type:complete